MNRKIIRFFVSNKIAWKFLSFFHRITNRFVFEKSLMNREKQIAINLGRENPLKYLFPDFRVQSGPFKGMKYVGFNAACKRVIPKMLGSYESELHPSVVNLQKNTYSEIINVGCAEGYYAVGLARIIPKAKIWCYDTSKTILEVCREMAESNAMLDRLILLNEFCTSNTLLNFKFSGRGLIICDCEGYEMELFTKENVKNLTNCDLIIELHDLVNMHISSTMEEIFSDTHQLELVTSQNPFSKARNFPHLLKLTDEELLICMHKRKEIMQWAVLTAKKN